MNNIAEIIERYKSMVFSIALTHVKCTADADDVFQEVFLALHRSGKSFNDDEHLKAWLIRTTLNCSRKSAMTAWKRHVVAAEEIEIYPEENKEFRFELEDENLIFNAVRSLCMKYCTVIELYYFEDMSVADIAKALGLREGTVRMQLKRGREALREILKEDYFDEQGKNRTNEITNAAE